MRKHRLLIPVLVGLVSTAAWSQSNEIIDSLLAQERASLGPTAYLVLSAAELLDQGATVEQAFAELQSKPWGFAKSSIDDEVELGAFAALVMKAFSMRGGIMYTILPGKRYAARELAWRGFVQGNTAPGRTLSGRDVTHILGKVLESLGQRKEEVQS